MMIARKLMMVRIRHLVAAAAVAAVHLALHPAGHAQIPTVHTNGTLADPAAPPPPEPAPAAPAPSQPTIITIGPDGKPIAPAETEDPSEFYYQEGYDSSRGDNRPTLGNGPVPPSHVVR